MTVFRNILTLVAASPGDTYLARMEIQACILSFLVELLGIPFTVAVPVLPILGAKALMRGKRPALLVISFIGLGFLAGLLLVRILG